MIPGHLNCNHTVCCSVVQEITNDFFLELTADSMSVLVFCTKEGFIPLRKRTDKFWGRPVAPLIDVLAHTVQHSVLTVDRLFHRPPQVVVVHKNRLLPLLGRALYFTAWHSAGAHSALL